MEKREKKINFIILNINAYANYSGKDMAGAMRIKNLFNPLLEKKEVSVSNLIILDLLSIEHNGRNISSNPDVDCLSIGYKSLKKPLSVIGFLRHGIRFIKDHRQKNSTNIIYSYQYIDIRNFLLLLYAKLKGFKIVFDLVEDLNHLEIKSFNDRLHMKFSRFFLKLIRPYADGIFVISNHLMKETLEITANKIPVFMLPISVDFKNIKTVQQTKDADDTIKVFYGGSFAQKDGLEYLLEAVNILEKENYKFKLILSGKGEPNDMERILKKVKNKDLVDYKGFLSTEAYFDLLNNVNICCMTRNNSAFSNAGFPFKLGEFLASGKVIIASRIGDVEKYIVHKESAYLVTPESTADIAEGLRYCFKNLDILSQTMGPKAKQIALKYFNSEVSSKYMLEKCLSICEN